MKRASDTCESSVKKRGRNSRRLRTAEVFLRPAAISTKFSSDYLNEATALAAIDTEFTDPVTTVI
jgi:hypothetical protein